MPFKKYATGEVVSDEQSTERVPDRQNLHEAAQESVEDQQPQEPNDPHEQ